MKNGGTAQYGESIEKEERGILSSSALHILAMTLMLCDHMWATLFSSAEWLICVGRLAFPIFAMIPIWLYNGKRGISSKGFRNFCYAFYLAHLLTLFLIWPITQ